ncbi:hypothetical protein VTN49DRAFT_2163 [Thermomyces lanuginosus]|uniref:uncharacterized protein n=1 Tax=Thermomyces lanuginosus TaxID=5541 RepID=UPI0037434B5B
MNATPTTPVISIDVYLCRRQSPSGGAGSQDSTGTITVKNLANGDSSSHTFTKQFYLLFQTSAERIVEDFQSGPEMAPFANFDTISFTDAPAVRNGTVI